VALRPTIFCAVPRLLNRVYDKVLRDTTHDANHRLTFNNTGIVIVVVLYGRSCRAWLQLLA
jgi:long-subunit acyl-CoA synthetase (AMP-forming)